MLPTAGAAPRALVPLHGDVERTECLDCGAQSTWPPLPLWRRCDLRCAACQGPVVPALTLFGGAIDDATAKRLREIEARCAVMLVLGDEAREPATVALLDRARQAGATVIFVSDGVPSYPRRPADISVAEPMERFLASLVPVLALGRMLPGRATHRTRRAAAMAAAKQGREGAG